MKKILCYILLAVSVFMLAACGCSTDVEKPTEAEPVVNASMPVDVRVFFLNAEGQMVAENRVVDSENIEYGIVEELLKGPNDKTLTNAIAGDVKILSVSVNDGVCTVDLSKEFDTANKGNVTKEAYAIYALTNSLCDTGRVEKVKINIEGNEEHDFGGHFYFGDTYECEPNYIRIEDRTN